MSSEPQVKHSTSAGDEVTDGVEWRRVKVSSKDNDSRRLLGASNDSVSVDISEIDDNLAEAVLLRFRDGGCLLLDLVDGG